MSQDFKHSFKVSQRPELSLTVYNVGFQKCPPDYGWGPGVRDHFLLHYIGLRPRHLRLRRQDFCPRSWRRLPGPAGHAHLLPRRSHGPLGVLLGGLFRPQRRAAAGPDPLFRQPPRAAPDRRDRAAPGPAGHLQGPGGGLSQRRAHGRYLQAALGLLMDAAPAHGTDALADYARRGADFIQQNYSRDISVEAVAAHVGVTAATCTGRSARFSAARPGHTSQTTGWTGPPSCCATAP